MKVAAYDIFTNGARDLALGVCTNLVNMADLNVWSYAPIPSTFRDGCPVIVVSCCMQHMTSHQSLVPARVEIWHSLKWSFALFLRNACFRELSGQRCSRPTTVRDAPCRNTSRLLHPQMANAVNLALIKGALTSSGMRGWAKLDAASNNMSRMSVSSSMIFRCS